jgi:hypothetical protein
VTPTPHIQTHVTSSNGKRNTSHHTLSFPLPVVPVAPAVVDTGGAGGMPVSTGDVFEVVVDKVVDADVLATVTLVESVLGDVIVNVEALVMLWEVVVSEVTLGLTGVGSEDVESDVGEALEVPDGNVVVSEVKLELIGVGSEDIESDVEEALEAPGGNVVVSGLALELTEVGSEGVESDVEGTLEASDSNVVVSVASEMGAVVNTLVVPPVVLNVGTWDVGTAEESTPLVEDVGTESCPEDVET